MSDKLLLAYGLARNRRMSPNDRGSPAKGIHPEEAEWEKRRSHLEKCGRGVERLVSGRVPTSRLLWREPESHLSDAALIRHVEYFRGRIHSGNPGKASGTARAFRPTVDVAPKSFGASGERFPRHQRVQSDIERALKRLWR